MIGEIITTAVYAEVVDKDDVFVKTAVETYHH